MSARRAVGVEERLEAVRRGLLVLRHGAGVDVQGERHHGVAEPLGDRDDRLAAP